MLLNKKGRDVLKLSLGYVTYDIQEIRLVFFCCASIKGVVERGDMKVKKVVATKEARLVGLMEGLCANRNWHASTVHPYLYEVDSGT
jgi:hypothetical protein